MSATHFYFHLKPYMPWGVRMAMRRLVARRKHKTCRDVWPINEAAAQPPGGWSGWPDGKKFAFVLTHDVEGPDGLAKCRQLMKLEQELGFRSCFNFIPEGDYTVSRELREELAQNGFEVGVHDLHHDGHLFRSRQDFSQKAQWINHYVQDWGAKGFRSGYMLRNLDWLHELDIQYDCSTFDTDPFEPQPDGVGTIFPFWVPLPEPEKSKSGNGHSVPPPLFSRRPLGSGPSGAGLLPSHLTRSSSPRRGGYVELPYTLPQDSTLFQSLLEPTPEIWFRKLDWIVQNGGMALVNVHPDNLRFPGEAASARTVPVAHYVQLLQYLDERYAGAYWQPLPHEIAAFWIDSVVHRPACPGIGNLAVKKRMEKSHLKVTIFGMGYVGSVTAACLAKQGHEVAGIDSDATKVDLINSAQSPIMEPGLEEIMQAMLPTGRLHAETRSKVLGDISLVCVGTPSNDNGSLDLRQVMQVCEDIGRLLKTTDFYHVVNIRSTVIPGTVEERIIPLLEKTSGKKAGIDFGVCMNPEFLRESTAVKDFYKPPFTVIGTSDKESSRIVAKLYEGVDAPLEIVPLRVAETIKYACNSFHALKVTFANEIGSLCKALGVDSWQVMEIFCKDNKLNLSPYYLKPGFAFGGSCLPKDLRAITHLARQLDLDLPLLGSILASNENQIERAYQMVRRTGKNKIGVLGLSFKTDSDDLRESPTVAFIERLIGKGYEVVVYDNDVTLSAIRGKNKQYIERTLPHVSSLMKSSLEEVTRHAEVLVVCKRQPEFETVTANGNGQPIMIDFVRLFQNGAQQSPTYDGICW